jgi:hypothetical protein
MTVRSATLVRAALGGAVVCLIAVGVTAPALAGSAEDGPSCPDPGAVEALLDGGSCADGDGEQPAPALAPGLLDPVFPDVPDFPGLPDDDGPDDDGSGDEGDGSDDAADEDEERGDEDGERDDESEGADDGSEADADEAAAREDRDSDDDSDDGSDDGEAGPATATDDVRQATDAATAVDAGAGTAVGSAVLPGVGDAVDRPGSAGLDWTGALTREAPGSPDRPRHPPVEPPAAPTPAPEVLRLSAPLPPGPPAQTGGLAAVAFATALPSPVDARWDLGAVLPSLALTLLLLAALALPAGALNRAAAEQPGRVDALLARLRVPPGAGPDTPVAFVAAVAVTAVAGAVLLGFLAPAFPFDGSAPALLVGLVIAFAVVTAAQQGSQLLYVTRWWGVRCHLGPVPGFLLLGAVAVVLSRAMGLEPGLVLGALVAFRSARPLRPDEEGPAVALAAAALTAVGALAWVLREPLAAAAGAPGTFLADVLATALTATAVSAAANLVFALVPVSFLPGAALLRWSPALWAVFACTGGFAFVHLVARPAADALPDRAGLLAVLLGVYLVGAAALLAWLRYGERFERRPLSPATRR